MDATHFTIRSPWLIRALGGSSLVRNTDRAEAAITAALTVLVVLFVPVAATIGAAVHRSQTICLSETLATRHQIAAHATAASAPTTEPAATAYRTPVRWMAGARVHDAVVDSAQSYQAGDAVAVWVDDSGTRVPAPPTATDIALASAITAVSVWGSVALTAIAVLALARRYLNRRRYADWDNDLRRMTDGGDKQPHRR